MADSIFAPFFTMRVPPFLRQRANQLALITILVVGFALRAHRMGALELWHDEVLSMHEANGVCYGTGSPPQGSSKADLEQYDTLSSALASCLQLDSGNGSLYVTVLHFWSKLWGNSPVALRMLSLLFSLSTVLLVYRFAKELFDERTALISAALTATWIMLAGGSITVRPYMMAAFLSTWSTFLLFRAVRSGMPSWRLVLLYGSVSGAAVLTHYSTAYILMAHVVAAFVLGTPFNRLLRIAAGGGLAVGIVLLWIALAGHEGLEQMRVLNQKYVDYLETGSSTYKKFLTTRPGTLVEGWIAHLLWNTGNGLQFVGPPLRVLALMLAAPAALVGLAMLKAPTTGTRRTIIALCVLLIASPAYATVLAIISGHMISFQLHYAVFSAPFGALLLGHGMARAWDYAGYLRLVAGAMAGVVLVVIVLSFALEPLGVSVGPNRYEVQAHRLDMAMERYTGDKMVAIHSSKCAAYLCALYAGPGARDLPHCVDLAYPGISGLIIERGDLRWTVPLRAHDDRYTRSDPPQSPRWETNLEPCLALPDSVDAWTPDLVADQHTHK